MMIATSPDDLPRIKIVREEHPSVRNFYRNHVQVFLGHAIPPYKDSDCPPIEDFMVGGGNYALQLLAGFGTDRLRREQAMKTAGRENPNRWAIVPSTRVHGATVQNRSRSIMRAGKQEKPRPKDVCFFLTSAFIELFRIYWN